MTLHASKSEFHPNVFEDKHDLCVFPVLNTARNNADLWVLSGTMAVFAIRLWSSVHFRVSSLMCAFVRSDVLTCHLRSLNATERLSCSDERRSTGLDLNVCLLSAYTSMCQAPVVRTSVCA